MQQNTPSPSPSPSPSGSTLLRPIPLPKTELKDASQYLSTYGITAQRCHVRSSDLSLALSDPFLFYLTRRLGLHSALSYSKALTAGSWFHEAAFQDPFTSLYPDKAEACYKAVLRDRLSELKESANFIGIIGEECQKILDREERIALTSLTWWKLLRNHPISRDVPNFIAWINHSRFTILGKEQLIAVPISGYDKAYRVIRPDLLLYNKKSDTIFIVDYKTTSLDPIDRLTACPIEFQTQHYLSVFHHYLTHAKSFPSTYTQAGVTPATKLGGIIHVAFLKCPLAFGQNDRPFTTTTRELSRGPRKGMTVTERHYSGEPSIDNFCARITEWYSGEGRYEELKPQRRASPPVNISSVPYDLALSRNGKYQYNLRLDYLTNLCTCVANPGAFIKNPTSILSAAPGMSQIFKPFYTEPVTAWPSLVQSLGLMRSFRDEKEIKLITDEFEDQMTLPFNQENNT